MFVQGVVGSIPDSDWLGLRNFFESLRLQLTLPEKEFDSFAVQGVGFLKSSPSDSASRPAPFAKAEVLGILAKDWGHELTLTSNPRILYSIEISQLLRFHV